jgi:hypothetical protein
LRQRWLCQVEAPGGAAEVEFLSNRDKIAEMPEFNIHTW